MPIQAMTDLSYRPGIGDVTGRRIEHEFGCLEFRYAPGNTCEIVNIEVDPDHRMQGIGRTLLEALFREVEGKARHVYAITRVENRIAKQFYEQTGFLVSGVLTDFYADDKTPIAILYCRSIKGPV